MILHMGCKKANDKVAGKRYGRQNERTKTHYRRPGEHMVANILDVGCGENKQGTIGVDIKRTQKVDVICDAHNLPFIEKF